MAITGFDFDKEKNRDLELWKRWKRTRSQRDLEALLKQMRGVIMKNARKWSGALPIEVLEIEANKIAVQAFDTYNPNAGTALSTHLTNYLQKLSRKTYKYQNPARLPEHRQIKFYMYQNMVQNFVDEHGRDPSIDEIADALGWNRKEVARIVKETRATYVESVGKPAEFSWDEGIADEDIDFFYHDLSPEDKVLFEHTTGYGGKPVLSPNKLAKKMGIPLSTLYYKRNNLATRIRKYVQKSQRL